VRWATEIPDIIGCEVLDGQFHYVSRETDTLVLARSNSLGKFLALFEFQTRYSTKMPRRMRSYAALAEEKFELPVYPILINILPYYSEIPPFYESDFAGLTARQDYKVINLWQISAEEVLNQQLTALVPFVPTMQGSNEALIEKAKASLVLNQELRITRRADELNFALALFTEAVFGEEMTRRIFGGKMIEIIAETSLYKEIIGRGLEAGLQQGREEESHKLLTKLLIKRFGSVDSETQTQIRSLSVEKCEELAEAIFDFQTVADLHSWLAKLQS
jgi:predicted transposase YdaD